MDFFFFKNFKNLGFLKMKNKSRDQGQRVTMKKQQR